MTPDLRRHPRLRPKLLSSRVRVGGALHLGLAVENLSLGGAFVRCASSPPLRTHATVELLVPGQAQPLVLPGAVVFVVTPAQAVAGHRAAGFAIQFVDALAPRTRQGLERLLRGLDPRAPIPLDTGAQPTGSMPTVPADAATDPSAELAVLRQRLAEQQRELDRLRLENERLRAAPRRS